MRTPASLVGSLALLLPALAAAAACSGIETGGLAPVGEGPAPAATSVDAAGGGSGEAAVDGPQSAAPSRDAARPETPAPWDPGAELDAATSRDGSEDAGIDASVDASPDGSTDDASVPEPCSRRDDVESRGCGRCGEQRRVCKLDEGGRLVWLPWGECVREAGACYPGTVVNEPCGRCGFRPRVCTADCRIEVGACTDRPGAQCYVGDAEWAEALSCPASSGRLRTCEPVTCRWGPFSNACVPYTHPYVLDAATVAGAGAASERERTYPLPVDATAPRLPSTSSCPLSASTSFTTQTAASFVLVRNPSTSHAVRLTIWQSGTPETPSADLLLAAYAGLSRPPQNDAERRACTHGVNDTCYQAPCASPFAMLQGVRLAPGGTTLVYTARYGSGTGTADDRYTLHVRTDALEPVPTGNGGADAGAP